MAILSEDEFGGYIQSLSKSALCTVPAQSSLVFTVNSFLISLPHQVVEMKYVCAQFFLFINSRATWNIQGDLNPYQGNTAERAWTWVQAHLGHSPTLSLT